MPPVCQKRGPTAIKKPPFLALDLQNSHKMRQPPPGGAGGEPKNLARAGRGGSIMMDGPFFVLWFAPARPAGVFYAHEDFCHFAVFGGCRLRRSSTARGESVKPLWPLAKQNRRLMANIFGLLKMNLGLLKKNAKNT